MIAVSAFITFSMIATVRAGPPEDAGQPSRGRGIRPADLDIVAAEGFSSYRSVVRSFSRLVQREFHSTFGFPYPGKGAPPIRIEIGFPRPFDMDVSHRVIKLPSGKARGVVMIPNPPAADYESIRLAIVSTIFQADLYTRANDIRKVTPPPYWFIRGLALQSAPEGRVRLFETAYVSWSHANLPTARHLLAADSVALSQPAVAAQIADWCASFGQMEARWNDLLDHLAGGGAWNSKTIGSVLLGFDDLSDLDADFDLWMAERPNSILDIGATSPTALRRLRSQLLIYPRESDIDYLLPDFPAGGLPLADCISHCDRPEVRMALQGRIQRFHLLAIGRDPVFQDLCTCYIEALQEALDDRHGEKARILWAKAEDKRMDLETRMAMGEILK